jgi:hypothetical protein
MTSKTTFYPPLEKVEPKTTFLKNEYKTIKRLNYMKTICYENLIENNIYYIDHNKIKYIGVFNKLHSYNYFSIALFNDVIKVNSLDKTITETAFIIGSYYNKVTFYVPELEQLLLKQILQQKVNDEMLANIMSKTLL